MGDSAFILDKNDKAHPRGFRARVFGRFRTFYPGGINPETQEFEPVILNAIEAAVLRQRVAGQALVKEVTPQELFKMQSAEQAKWKRAQEAAEREAAEAKASEAAARAEADEVIRVVETAAAAGMPVDSSVPPPPSRRVKHMSNEA